MIFKIKVLQTYLEQNGLVLHLKFVISETLHQSIKYDVKSSVSTVISLLGVLCTEFLLFIPDTEVAMSGGATSNCCWNVRTYSAHD